MSAPYLPKWRPILDDGYHAFVRSGKNSSLGMNFTSLCERFWMSTIKYYKPKPYPPTTDLCEECKRVMEKNTYGRS
jgi:hypothetical protein